MAVSLARKFIHLHVRQKIIIKRERKWVRGREKELFEMIISVQKQEFSSYLISPAFSFSLINSENKKKSLQKFFETRFESQKKNKILLLTRFQLIRKTFHLKDRRRKRRKRFRYRIILLKRLKSHWTHLKSALFHSTQFSELNQITFRAAKKMK